MVVIDVENAPPRLRGYLRLYLLELRAGLYAGRLSARTCEQVWRVVRREIGQGSALLAKKAANDLGVEVLSCGRARYARADFDGLDLTQLGSRGS